MITSLANGSRPAHRARVSRECDPTVLLSCICILSRMCALLYQPILVCSYHKCMYRLEASSLRVELGSRRIPYWSRLHTSINVH